MPEGTGTRPDYLVNHGQKKWGAIRGKKLHRNREIDVEWMVRVVGAHGQLTQSAILRNPRTIYKRSLSIFFTSIAPSCARVCTQLLKPHAQSIIWSPGTLNAHDRLRWSRDRDLQIARFYYRNFISDSTNHAEIRRSRCCHRLGGRCVSMCDN